MDPNWSNLLIGGFLGLLWVYVAARLAARAVLRTLNERKRDAEA